LELLKSTDQRGEVWRVMTEAQLTLGRFEEATKTARRAVELGTRAGNRAQEGAALRTLGRVHRASGDAESAFAAFEAAIECFEASGQKNEVARTREEQSRTDG
jgi:cytochrome c-type biogenesis protein CcmH/NrfG